MHFACGDSPRPTSAVRRALPRASGKSAFPHVRPQNSCVREGGSPCCHRRWFLLPRPARGLSCLRHSATPVETNRTSDIAPRVLERITEIPSRSVPGSGPSRQRSRARSGSGCSSCPRVPSSRARALRVAAAGRWVSIHLGDGFL